MVGIATSLGRNGLQDWLIQRVTALILAVYLVFLLVFWLTPSNQNYLAWNELFNTISMRYATLVVLLALLAHAWIGFWVVSTDYLPNKWVRLIAQISVVLLLIFYLSWGLIILWP